MFEPSSAMTSIAEDGEFRFARFYIVCEAVPLGTLGNPLIVCGLSDTFRGLSKRGRDTESDAKTRQEEMHAFFSTNVPSAFPSEIGGMCLLPYCLPRQKGLSASSDSPLVFWRVLKKLFVQQIVVLDGSVDRVRHFLHCLLRCLLVI